ncbi:MAG: hypothetical protein LBO66_00625 [Deltaproteobacteria bacterium]|jgi:hypothetical protein|nr:hypothetical protein [Deltaproteobacteria bacterium]
MEKRHYADFFTVPQDYKANMTREAINETPETWLDFYPHVKYMDFLNALITAINGDSKSLWLTGNYGTGKSNAALVTQKLFMDDEDRVRTWFERYEQPLKDGAAILKSLLERRSEGTLVVYDYDASGVGPTEDFLVRLERGIVSALGERSLVVPAKANLDKIIFRLKREDKNFFKTREAMQSELTYLTENIYTIDQLVTELHKVNQHGATPTGLLGDVQKVLHRDNIFLDISVTSFREWIQNILSANNCKRIVYIFDEFSEFIDANKEQLKYFEDVAENPSINKFYLVPVTHLSIQAYWSEGSTSAKKANDRFNFRNLQMPNDTAFELACHAMKPIEATATEWEKEKKLLWDSVRGIAEFHFKEEDVRNESFRRILPIHPMAAFLLKSLSEHARSNQRSIFEYLKGDANGSEFQRFIQNGGPSIHSKQFLTADYLWKYFIEREDLGLSKEIVAIRAEYERIKSREFSNRDEDDEDIRVLKAVLLFCLLSRLLTEGSHDRLKPTVENIELTFKGDGVIANVKSILKGLVDKHCFSVVNGNIELFASSVHNNDLQNKITEYQSQFHQLLSDKTAESLKAYRKSDFSKFSTGRFELRVSDVKHTTLQYIQPLTRDKFTNGLNKDTGAVCLWFVVAKNKEEQLQIPDKIRSILNQLHDHRIIMFTFPNLTFCDTNQALWDDYIEQFAKYNLENDDAAKKQSKSAFERIEQTWFAKFKETNVKLQYYTNINKQILVNDLSWAKFYDMLHDYVCRTLEQSLDYLTQQTTAFGHIGLAAWATAGILFESTTNPYKQLLTAFKTDGITADLDWFAQNASHPIAKIRELFDKKIANTVGKGTNLSIRKVYITLQRAPYGLKCNGLSAFGLGVALRYILDKGYQWDNLQKTGSLDTVVLAEIIESVVKDDGQGKIKNEKFICRLSREEKSFVENAPLMFGITNTISDARVEDVLLQIQNRVEQISCKVPLWVLPEYINSTGDNSATDISAVLNNICSAGSTSSKSGKPEDRTAAIKRVGQILLDNPTLIRTVSGYVKTPNFVTAFEMYVDRNAPDLLTLAESIGDSSHGYCEAILAKAADSAGLLWKQADISTEIEETTYEYEIIKLLKPVAGFSSFVSYKDALETLRDAVMSKNKLPKTLITTAVPSLSAFISTIANTGAASDIRDGLMLNTDIVKALFFDFSKAKTVELLKQRLTSINISDTDLLAVYDRLPNAFSQDELAFLDDVRKEIEIVAKESLAFKIKEEWERISGTKTPDDWAITNGIPAKFMVNDIAEASDILTAISNPSSFSTDRLGDLLNIMNGISAVSVDDCLRRFETEIIPRRFAKLNISLSSLLEYLEGEYGKANNWPTRLDISDFMRRQYKETLAPQVIEKLKQTSAEELKIRLLQLAQKNPDLGLFFWED